MLKVSTLLDILFMDLLYGFKGEFSSIAETWSMNTIAVIRTRIQNDWAHIFWLYRIFGLYTNCTVPERLSPIIFIHYNWSTLMNSLPENVHRTDPQGGSHHLHRFFNYDYPRSTHSKSFRACIKCVYCVTRYLRRIYLKGFPLLITIDCCNILNHSSLSHYVHWTTPSRPHTDNWHMHGVHMTISISPLHAPFLSAQSICHTAS